MKINGWVLGFLLCALPEMGFSYDRWIVVTTIQYPTDQLRKIAQIPDWHLVVVGDLKTPKDWHLDNCEYLSPERQLELNYEITSLLPWNHYSRKNIGYLYAIENGAKIIYETDDDNEPIDTLAPCAPMSTLPSLTTEDSCVNIFGYFGHPEVWPRGFPLDKILNLRPYQVAAPSPCRIGIEHGVINASPDVDAIFRLTQDKYIEFVPQQPCYLPQGIFCPFNSQNTFFHPIAFFTLYLPSSVSMRVSDIWRGYIAQNLLWKLGAHLVFSGPNAIQERNPHRLLNDFFLEQALYLQGTALIEFLKQWDSIQSDDPFLSLFSIFQELIKAGFVQDTELPLLRAWINDLERIGYREAFNP